MSGSSSVSVTIVTSSTDSSTSSTSSTSGSKQIMHHSQLPKINISSGLLSTKSNTIVIFPESNLSEEPASLDEETLPFSLMSNCPSPIERKMDRYKKLRAMHERAGRLPKSPGNNSN